MGVSLAGSNPARSVIFMLIDYKGKAKLFSIPNINEKSDQKMA